MNEISNHIAYVLKQLSEGENLLRVDVQSVMRKILNGEAEPVQIAAFLMGLRVKNETPEEIAGAVDIMRENMISIKAPDNTIDIVGTGGDNIGTYNISTSTAFVVAAGDVPVAKHGNRAFSSKSGAADILSYFGLPLEYEIPDIERCLETCKICFLYAPQHHPAVRFVQPVRKSLGIKTIFNITGPMSNPANVKNILLGVYSPNLIKPVVEALNKLEVKNAVVVHGAGGVDEFSCAGSNEFALLRNGKISFEKISPEDVGLKHHSLNDIIGGTPQKNAAALKDMLAGNEIYNAYRDTVALNAGVAFYLSNKTNTIKEGVELALKIIHEGKALDKLNKLIDFFRNIQRKDLN